MSVPSIKRLCHREPTQVKRFWNLVFKFSAKSQRWAFSGVFLIIQSVDIYVSKPSSISLCECETTSSVSRKKRGENTELCFIFPSVWKSERKSGSEMFRFTRRTTLQCVPALPPAAAHPPLLSKGLEEQRAAEHVRNRRVGASFLSLTAASWICDSVRFSLLLISNVLSVDQDVAVMSVTRCCVQNSSREVVQFSGFLS